MEGKIYTGSPFGMFAKRAKKLVAYMILTLFNCWAFVWRCSLVIMSLTALLIMYADEPLLDCHDNTTLKLGQADLHRPLTIRCTGRAYPPADVIFWTWRDVIVPSYDVIDDVIDRNVGHVRAGQLSLSMLLAAFLIAD